MGVDEFKIQWDDEEPTGSDEEAEGFSMKIDNPPAPQPDTKEEKAKDDGKTIGQLDIMAQQLKFIACLKILMEELSTLATGFEVDGGQLRYQLYVWLEREVEALKTLCNYSSGDSEPVISTVDEFGNVVDISQV